MSLSISGVVRIMGIDRRASSNGNFFTTCLVANDVYDGQENKTHAVSCVAFGKTGENLWTHTTKGSRIEIKQADLTMSKRQDQQGQDYPFPQASLVINRFDFIDSKEDKEKLFAKHPKEEVQKPAGYQPQAQVQQQAQQHIEQQVQQPAFQQPAPVQQVVQQPVQPVASAAQDEDDEIPF